MSSLSISSNFLIKKHLQLIDFFLPQSSEDLDNLNIKIGFTLTCLYMWSIQTVYCGIVGIYAPSIICFLSTLVYLFVLILLKQTYISTIFFSRLIISISILNLHLCYIYAGAYTNPTIVWLMGIPVVAIILTGLKEGAVWSFFSSVITITLMELYHEFNWSLNTWSKLHTYEVGQSNMFTGPLLFYIMFGFFYYSRIQLHKKIQEQAKKIKEVAIEKDKLLNVIFHDLGRNTSLLSGYLELTEKGNLTKEAQAKLYRHAEEIKSILKNAKNLDTHRIVKELEEVNIYDTWLALREIYENKLSNKKLDFVYEGSKSISLFTRKTHLQSHILSNLVSNAIKFSHLNNQIIFNATRNEIKITNIGIPFSNSQKLGTNKEVGNGIGLEIVRDFCQKNNFNFYIESENGLTTAKITLP